MTHQAFSLSHVSLRHYRSIASAEVHAGPLLILVGPNGSGKSNFLDALRLVSDALLTSIDQALRSRGGVAEVRRRSTGHPTHFAIDLQVRWPGFEAHYGFEIGAVKPGGFKVTRESCSVWQESIPHTLPPYASFRVADGKVIATTEKVMPPATAQRLYLVSAAGIEAFRPVFDGLAGINVYSINPEMIRQPQTPDMGDLLRRDGSNVASVVHRLERVDSAALDRIEDYLQLIVPGMHSVSRADLGNWETVEFTQDVPGSRRPWRFQAQSVSDGTLRALGILVALFGGAPGLLSAVGIEEPESALHPAAAGTLLDALRDASERRQVLVTSHSPDLLDRYDFTLSEILAVRSVGGETIIDQMDDAGQLAMMERLVTPGELLRTDQLQPLRRQSLRASNE